MLNKLKRYILADINRFLLIVFFGSLPFERIPSFEIFSISIKISTIIGLVIILRALYLIHKRVVHLNVNYLYFILGCFLFWLVLLLPEVIDFNIASQFIAFNSFVILLCVSIAILFKKQYLKPIIISVLFTASIASIFALYQYVADIMGLPLRYTGLRELYSNKTFGFPRVQAFSIEPLQLAVYMMLPFSVALSISLIKNNITSAKLSAILLSLFSLVIFLTLSRGGIYALLVTSFITIIYCLYKRYTNLKKAFIAISCILLGLILCLFIVNFVKKPPSSFTNGRSGASAYVNHSSDITSDPGDIRAKARKIAIVEIMKSSRTALLGIGPGQYAAYVSSHIYIADSPYLNNLTLSLFLELGVIGIMLVMLFFGGVFFAIFKILQSTKSSKIRIFSIAICIYLIAQGIQYQTYAILYMTSIWSVAGIALALISNNKKNNS